MAKKSNKNKKSKNTKNIPVLTRKIESRSMKQKITLQKDKNKENTKKYFKNKKISKITNIKKRSKRNTKNSEKNSLEPSIEYELTLDNDLLNTLDYIEFNNNLNNLPHDKFKKYDIPKTVEQNQTYLNKLISQNDVILELLDSRDIYYFLSEDIQDSLINNENKLLIYVLTKADLVSENYINRMKSKLSKETNNKIPILIVTTLNREKIQTFYNELISEISKFKQSLKTSKKKGNYLLKVGIIGRPNVGKNSLIQSFELLNNSNCNDKLISFDGNEIFCVNSVPANTYGIPGDKIYLMSPRYKNVEEVTNPLILINDLFKYVDKNKIKEIYELPKMAEDIQELIGLLKKKFGIKNDKSVIQQILRDIITGKISYEINY